MQAGRKCAFLERLPRGRLLAVSAAATCGAARLLGGEDLLRLVHLAALERGEPFIVERQVGEQLEIRTVSGDLAVARTRRRTRRGDIMSALSHTAPLSVLPSSAPDAVVSSGVVKAQQFGVEQAAAEVDAVVVNTARHRLAAFAGCSRGACRARPN